jgi:hypothetical protein
VLSVDKPSSFETGLPDKPDETWNCNPLESMWSFATSSKLCVEYIPYKLNTHVIDHDLICSLFAARFLYHSPILLSQHDPLSFVCHVHKKKWFKEEMAQ